MRMNKRDREKAIKQQEKINSIFSKEPAWKVSCSFRDEQEAQMVYDYIEQNCKTIVTPVRGNVMNGLCKEYSPTIKIKFPKIEDDGTVCEHCGKGWHLHDFGVPHPLCPSED